MLLASSRVTEDGPRLLLLCQKEKQILLFDGKADIREI